MRRNAVLLLLGSALLALIGVVPAQAGGGHGCTEGFEDAAGATVITKGVCFSPTVVRIDPGDTVEFKNSDGLPHTVGGIAGSFGDLFTKLHSETSVSYRFQNEGTYPYACMLHPGMGGAVVVGDGMGKTMTAGVVEVDPPTTQGQPAAASEPVPPDRGWLIPAGIALGVAVLGLAALPRRRRTGSAVL